MPVRNARVVRFTLRVDPSIDERLERLADHMGQSKVVTTGVVIAAGLGLLEDVMYRANPEEVAAAGEVLLRRMGRDMERNLDAAASEDG